MEKGAKLGIGLNPADAQWVELKSILPASKMPQSQEVAGKAIKASLFDLDGTLNNNYLGDSFAEYLRDAKLYRKDVYERLDKVYKQSESHQISYGKCLELWTLLWAEAMKGMQADEIAFHAKIFFDGFKSNIYPSSYKLVEMVRNEGMLPVIVSAGPIEVISLAAKELGVDSGQTYATKLKTDEKIYTGELETVLHLPKGKEKAVDDIISRNNATIFLAFGNADSDGEMLEKAVHPIALNPNSDLQKIAIEREWKIFDKGNVVDGVSALLRKNS